MLELQQIEAGVIVPVRAQPKARRNAITGEHAGRLRIVVTAPPEKGKANSAIAEILAEALRVPASRVSLIAGTAVPLKKFLVIGMTLESVRDLLAPQLTPRTESTGD